MNKILSTAMVSAVLATSVSAANLDFIKGDFYGGAGIGIENFSHYSSYDPGVTVVFNGGKPIIKLAPGTIGAEGEITYTSDDIINIVKKYKLEQPIITNITHYNYIGEELMKMMNNKDFDIVDSIRIRMYFDSLIEFEFSHPVILKDKEELKINMIDEDAPITINYKIDKIVGENEEKTTK